ncbi:MAG: aminotransferase class V-fold PLP-dependent enzyme [Phycisphaerales bacterium]|nr:aminotransferase class V-fold PLP-dependent enzyme [Phycisphaerales bacterium]
MSNVHQPPPSFGPEIKAQFALESNLTFLNHGSFGALPLVVRQAQEAWRVRIESNPIEWIGRRNIETLMAVKKHLARFVGCQPNDLGFVTNASEGVNAVLRSLRFEAGDELLTCDHVYNAVRQAMKSRAQETGARVVEVPIALPVRDQDHAMNCILNAITPRTRLIVIDHITSPTALRFDVRKIIDAVKGTRVQVLVDGAHAPGALQLSLDTLGAHFYAANLHKWTMAPRGSAFVWVAPQFQKDIHPCIISHEFANGFTAEFDWQGTRDLSAWNTVPAALAWFEKLGSQRVLQHNHQLAAWAHQLLCEEFSFEPLSPLDGSMLSCMASMRLPNSLQAKFDKPEAFQKQLLDADHIEVPIIEWNQHWLLRVSAAIHNEPAHYERLVVALKKYLA